jgi:hypothetical protein
MVVVDAKCKRCGADGKVNVEGGARNGWMEDGRRRGREM